MWSGGNNYDTFTAIIDAKLLWFMHAIVVRLGPHAANLHLSFLGKVKTFEEEIAIEMPTGKNIKFVRLVFNSDPLCWSNWNLECWFL